MPSNFLTQLKTLRRRHTLERSCKWTPGQLAAHQARSVGDLRRFAYERSPFYASFHKGLENRPLHELPVLTKALLMEEFDRVVTDRTLKLADVEQFLAHDDGGGFYQDRYVVLSTSGSTGRRGVFLYDKSEWIDCLAAISRPLKWAGLKPRLFTPTRGAMVASTTPWHYSARVGRSLATKRMPMLRLDAGEPTGDTVKRLNEWRPEFLTAYPSVLRQLADEQIAGRLRISPRIVACSAEVLTVETRHRVREAWGVRVFETYGATEYAPIAAECDRGRRHLLEDGAVIEVVDEAGRAVPTGEAGERILLTIFGRKIQPLIRYEISDIVRIAEGECGCGRPFRFIGEIEGRREDVLCFPSRSSSGIVSIHPNAFHRVLETIPASGWQVIQEAGRVDVHFTGLKDSAVIGPVEAALRSLLRAEDVVELPVRVHVVAQLQRGATGKAPLILAKTGRPS